jgi:tetratricopeptide (TPR) repeat protein
MPMIYSRAHNTKYPFIFVTFLCLVISSCRNNEDDKELLWQSKKADSLSIQLNAPELKAINAQLLKNPADAQLYNERALVYMRIKQLPEAVFDAKRAIKFDSTNATYYLTLVDAYFAQNSTKLAKELLEILERKFPDNVEALLKLSELYFLVRQYQKAIDYVNKALEVDKNSAKAYFLKGSIYKESGDTNRAISSLETSIEQDNTYEDAFYDLGLIYAARKNPLAFEYYISVLRINPKNEQASYARAKLLQDLGKIDEAISTYESILSKNKNCDQCYYNIGAIYLELKKDTKKAIDYFTKAIALNPAYSNAYFARGYAYSKLNDKKNAKADYNACLSIEPNHEGAIMGVNKL